jgi:hypothetical protein
MSKTDKTRPFWVRMADTPGLTSVPVHDHRFGPCTLPDRIHADTRSDDAAHARCFWGSGGYHVIGCPSDGGSCSREWQAYRREANRRDRYQARRALRRYRDED